MFSRFKYYILIFFIISLIAAPSLGSAYSLGIFSQSKTVQEVLDNEKKIGFQFPVVAFIFDNYSIQGSRAIKNIAEKLGTGRTYHISLSPENLSAKQVAEGSFDDQYIAFFKDVKKYNLKILFRTMHEMNGGRYSRSNDPDNFKKARKRIYKLSRDEGLDTDHIQFIFSFNWHDMPVVGGQKPSQSSSFITCTPAKKKETQCLTREDYYPGIDYVDILGFSAYNRGKATSNRKRLSMREIMNDPTRNNRSRALAKEKPIYIDEIGTTAVSYTEHFSWPKSQETYRRASDDKSNRLKDLSQLIDKTPQIIGLNYFNVDYTNGLRDHLVGEADRKIIDSSKGMMYHGGRDLIKNNDTLDVGLIFAGKDKVKKIVFNSRKVNKTIVVKTPEATANHNTADKIDIIQKPVIQVAVVTPTQTPKTIIAKRSLKQPVIIAKVEAKPVVIPTPIPKPAAKSKPVKKPVVLAKKTTTKPVVTPKPTPKPFIAQNTVKKPIVIQTPIIKPPVKSIIDNTIKTYIPRSSQK